MYPFMQVSKQMWHEDFKNICYGKKPKRLVIQKTYKIHWMVISKIKIWIARFHFCVYKHIKQDKKKTIFCYTIFVARFKCESHQKCLIIWDKVNLNGRIKEEKKLIPLSRNPAIYVRSEYQFQTKPTSKLWE